MAVEHVFVLMLENRSFDHMLGFSGISGADAVTGLPASIDGLTGRESNFNGATEYRVTRGADWQMPLDPAHEFPDVVHQLCGPDATYSSGGAYPATNNTGFVTSYVGSGGTDAGEIMKCYTPNQLPVLNALAHEFVVCDRWHASMPGPTWPNRMFVHGASSGGLDHSPTVGEIALWEGLRGFPLPGGTIFDRLQAKGLRRRLYGGDDFPMVAALRGIQLLDIRHYSSLANDLKQPGYADRYIFIEPAYDVLNKYRNGNSQHPLGDVTRGEALIKQTYETIRNSPVWNNSLLIVLWDEHGGFYDHVQPGIAPAPADNTTASYNQNGFTFQQYGARVPALVISPLIPKNQIDHRQYDHASIPATLESLFGMAPLTNRDRSANAVNALCKLSTPRTDAPTTLPSPAAVPVAHTMFAAADTGAGITTVAAPEESVNSGNLPAIVHSAMKQDLAISPAGAHDAIVARVASMRTRADAMEYMAEVQKKILPVRARAAHQ